MRLTGLRVIVRTGYSRVWFAAAADTAASLASDPLDLIPIDSCFAALDAALLAGVAADVIASN